MAGPYPIPGAAVPGGSYVPGIDSYASGTRGVGGNYTIYPPPGPTGPCFPEDGGGVISYVGPRQGQYRESRTYTYVGRGGGDFGLVGTSHPNA